jgi:hypothetical protein
VIIKIIIFYVIVFGILFEEREYRVLQKLMQAKTLGIFLAFIYIGSFLLLFGLELRAKLLKNISYKKLKQAAFFFSFWVGVCFALFIPFTDGRYPKFYSVSDGLTFALGCAIFGILAGGLGILLTPLYLKYVFGEDKNGNID